MQRRWLGAAIFAAACAGAAPFAPAPAPSSRSPERLTLPSAAASFTPNTPPAPSALPELPAPAAAAVSDEPPVREAVAGSTLGSVACGSARCQSPREVCTMRADRSAWECVPRNTELEDGYYACDDASDCSAPLVCCRSFASASDVLHCALPQGDCAAIACAEPDGKQCPRGQRCAGTFCAAEARATCASGQRCPADAPYCVWSSSPSCVDAGEAENAAGLLLEPNSAILGVYACTKPGDCGTQHCCTSMVSGEKLTRCSHACDAANSMRVCATRADCKWLADAFCEGEDAPACRARLRCEPPTTDRPNATPPWLKVCSLGG